MEGGMLEANGAGGGISEEVRKVKAVDERSHKEHRVPVC